MTKCDFCKMSDSFGVCYWFSQPNREDDCKKAIKKMTKALSSMNSKKKHKNKR